MAQGVNVRELTMGPISRKVRKRATPEQWQKIIRKAQKRGYTVESLLDQSIPKALKERTRPSLQKQATKTMQKVYAPVEKDISQREQRVQAIDEKRGRDNQYYLDWLRGRSDQMMAASKQADARMREEHATIASDAAAQTQAVRQEMMQAAGAVPGNVSDPSQAKAFDVTDEAARNNAMLASSRDETNRMIGSQESRMATTDASNFALMAASEAKRSSETWAKMADLGDERQKVQLSKAADAAKEVARLLDQEGAKAESNREFQAVAQKLGVSLAGVEQRDKASKRSARQQALNRKAQNKRANDELAFKQTKQQFEQGLDQAKLDISQGNLDLGWYKALHPSKGKGGGSGGAGEDPMMSSDPQTRFEYGYALVATSVRQGKPNPKTGQYPNKQYDRKWVGENQNLVQQQLIKKGFSRRMAKTIVNAFVQKNGAEPGDVGRYRPEHKEPSGPK